MNLSQLGSFKGKEPIPIFIAKDLVKRFTDRHMEQYWHGLSEELLGILGVHLLLLQYINISFYRSHLLCDTFASFEPRVHPDN